MRTLSVSLCTMCFLSVSYTFSALARRLLPPSSLLTLPRSRSAACALCRVSLPRPASDPRRSTAVRSAVSARSERAPFPSSALFVFPAEIDRRRSGIPTQRTLCVRINVGHFFSKSAVRVSFFLLSLSHSLARLFSRPRALACSDLKASRWKLRGTDAATRRAVVDSPDPRFSRGFSRYMPLDP